MIYIVTLFTICCLVYNYDIQGKEKYKTIWFYIVLVLLTSISAFSYCVGADTPGYMYAYDAYNLENFSKDMILHDNIRIQPLWSLLIYGCHIFSDNYLFFKIVQAVVLNFSVMFFIKKNSRYWFIGILLYCIFMYLDYNFNIMRQSFSLACFLFGYKYYREGKLLKYYLSAFCAIMFHVGAIIVLFLPLFNIIKYNKNVIVFIILPLLFMALVALKTSFSIVTSLLTFFPADLSALGDLYMSSEKLGIKEGGLTSYLKSGIIIFFYFYVLYYSLKYKLIENRRDAAPLVMFIFLSVLSIFLPILFRFNGYFTVIMICVVSQFIIDFPKKRIKDFKKLSIVFLLSVYILVISPLRSYFAFDTFVGVNRWTQYYPYYSVFNKQIDRDRAMIWGYHE